MRPQDEWVDVKVPATPVPNAARHAGPSSGVMPIRNTSAIRGPAAQPASCQTVIARRGATGETPERALRGRAVGTPGYCLVGGVGPGRHPGAHPQPVSWPGTPADARMLTVSDLVEYLLAR